MISFILTLLAGTAAGATLTVYWPKLQAWLAGETAKVEQQIKDKL
jgi:hypothetical protein